MPSVPHMEVPMPNPQVDHGFGLAATEGDFEAAWDVLEWKLWGPWESDGSGERE